MCLILLDFLLLSFVVFSVCRCSSLYDPNDPLWELDSANFDRIVLHKNNAWIIEFYNSWCGHCIRFAPTWKEFSRDVQNWKAVIEVAVVNCAESENTKLCNTYKVHGYPTIKLFPLDLNNTDIGQPFSEVRDVEHIRKKTVDFLESLGRISPNWPDFQPISHTNLETFWVSQPIKKRIMYIIVERPNSYLGREVLLDLSHYRNVMFRRLLTTNKNFIPSIKSLFTNSSIKAGLLRVNRVQHVEILHIFDQTSNNSLIRDMIFNAITSHRRISILNSLEVVREEPKDLMIRKGVHMVDLENAVRYVFHQEVALYSDISGAKFSALRDFIFALQLHFPGTPVVQGYLTKLSKWIDKRKNNMTGDRFLHALENIQGESEYLPEIRTYIGCKGSSLKFRGYPCSLWTLFHTLLTEAYNAYELNNSGTHPKNILFAIKGYVKHFFSCQECSTHFRQLSSNVENEVQTPKDVILWLWRVHNSVNKRLSGDESEDPVYPKIQFPSVSSCPKCRIPNGTNEILWDENAVVRYLQYYYKKENLITIYEDTEMLPNSESETRTADIFFLERWNFRWFSETDVSLCLSLYVISALLLVILYLLFVQKRNRKRLYFRTYLNFQP